MALQVFFKNKKSGKKFKVVKTRKEGDKTIITLQGDNLPFDEEYTKERFERFGYELVKEEVDA